MAGETRWDVASSTLDTTEEAGAFEDVVSEAWTSDPETLGEPRDLYLILYPKEREETIIRALETLGVPGYTEFPKCIGRGRRIRHFDNPTWPGATGAVFTVIGSDQAPALVRQFRQLDRELEERSRGIAGLHMFVLPCRQVI